jgi:hypothetical protein
LLIEVRTRDPDCDFFFFLISLFLAEIISGWRLGGFHRVVERGKLFVVTEGHWRHKKTERGGGAGQQVLRPIMEMGHYHFFLAGRFSFQKRRQKWQGQRVSFFVEKSWKGSSDLLQAASSRKSIAGRPRLKARLATLCGDCLFTDSSSSNQSLVYMERFTACLLVGDDVVS